MIIGIVNYDLSNIFCVCSAVNYLGFKHKIINKPEDLKNVDKIILPGVGAFGDAINNLKKKQLFEALSHSVINQNKILLGICLGAQLICTSSTEFGFHEGFGWINAKVKKIKSKDKSFRIPHTGWDNFSVKKDCSLLTNIEKDSLFYFTHSYGVFCEDNVNIVANCNYSEVFSVIINHENIFGVQFHPEKSQKKGIELIKNFSHL